MTAMAFEEKGRREGLCRGLITPDSLLVGVRREGTPDWDFAGVRSTPDSATVGGFDFELFFVHQRDRIGGRELSWCWDLRSCSEHADAQQRIQMNV